MKTIDREELKKKIDRGDHFKLLETNSEESYLKWHLPGAINLPPERIAELVPQLLPDKSAEIVVYCTGPT